MATAIVWMRNALRIHDNPPLHWASNSPEVDSVVPVFVMDPSRGMGEEGRNSDNRMMFLYDSITDLDNRLRGEYGSSLVVLQGEPESAIPLLAREVASDGGWLVCDYLQDPVSRREVESIRESVAEFGVETRAFPSVSTVLDIESVVADEGYREPKSSSDIDAILRSSLGEGPDGCLVPEPLGRPVDLKPDATVFESLSESESLSGLLVSMDGIAQRSSVLGVGEPYFRGGEGEALDRLRRKVSDMPDFVRGFSKPSTMSTNDPDNPMEPSTTGLSPYLSTGCLSVRTVWHECLEANLSSDHTKPPQSLIGQLMFREMFYLLSRSVENWDDDVGNSNCKPIEWGEYD